MLGGIITVADWQQDRKYRAQANALFDELCDAPLVDVGVFFYGEKHPLIALIYQNDTLTCAVISRLYFNGIRAEYLSSAHHAKYISSGRQSPYEDQVYAKYKSLTTKRIEGMDPPSMVVYSDLFADSIRRDREMSEEYMTLLAQWQNNIGVDIDLTSFWEFGERNRDSLFKDEKTNILHELIHFIDDYRFKDPEGVFKHEVKRQKDEEDAPIEVVERNYYHHPVEFNAHYQQVISEVESWPVGTQIKFLRKPFDKFAHALILGMANRGISWFCSMADEAGFQSSEEGHSPLPRKPVSLQYGTPYQRFLSRLYPYWKEKRLALRI